MDWLRKYGWIDRNKFPDNPNSFYYFLHPQINRQIVESVLSPDFYKLSQTKNMSSEISKFFKEEISKLNAVDINLLTNICSKPRLLSTELGKNLSCAIQTKNKHLKKLVDVQLVTREKDPDFEGTRYHYYPANDLNIDILQKFLKIPISIKREFDEEIEVDNSSGSTSVNKTNCIQKDSAISPEANNIFLKLNQIEAEKQEIEGLQKKIEERKRKMEELKEEMILTGGEEAKKYFS